MLKYNITQDNILENVGSRNCKQVILRGYESKWIRLLISDQGHQTKSRLQNMKVKTLDLEFYIQIQFSSVIQSYPTLQPHGLQQLGFPVYHQLPELAETHVLESVMPSNHLVLCRPLLLPSIFSSIRVFSDELDLRIRWPKYWSFSFSISLSNEYSELISFRIDWFDLLAVQGTLKSFFSSTTI